MINSKDTVNTSEFDENEEDLEELNNCKLEPEKK